MFKFSSQLALLGALFFFCFQPVPAQQVAPAPPQFTLDKKLPGEDQFSWARPVFSPDSKYVAAFGHTAKTINVWDVATGELVAEVKESVEGFDGVDGFDFSNDGRRLILMRKDLPLTFIDWKTGEVARKIDIKADPKKILSHDFSDDQNILVLGTMSNGVQVWDVKSGTKLKSFLPGQAIASVDYISYKTADGKTARKIAYGRYLQANDAFADAAGIIDLDSGATASVLKEVPADKIPDPGSMTLVMVNWQWGGGHLLVSYYQIPPKVAAGLIVVDANTKKYVKDFELGQKTINLSPKYLWKPYHGLSISTNDMSNPMQPVKSSTQFVVFTQDGPKILDAVDESLLPVQSINYNRDNSLAVITQKRSMTEPATISIFKITPK